MKGARVNKQKSSKFLGQSYSNYMDAAESKNIKQNKINGEIRL